MKQQQITLTIVLILLCVDVILLVMDRKAHAKLDEQSFVMATEQKPSINDVTKSVRNMLTNFPENEEGDSPQAERRQLIRILD